MVTDLGVIGQVTLDDIRADGWKILKITFTQALFENPGV